MGRKEEKGGKDAGCRGGEWLVHGEEWELVRGEGEVKEGEESCWVHREQGN